MLPGQSTDGSRVPAKHGGIACRAQLRLHGLHGGHCWQPCLAPCTQVAHQHNTLAGPTIPLQRCASAQQLLQDAGTSNHVLALLGGPGSLQRAEGQGLHSLSA